MKNLIIAISIFNILLLGNACKRVTTPEAAKEREEWISTFSDSIDIYSKEKDLATDSAKELNLKTASLITEFEHVIRPREVSGYFVPKGWENKLPMTSTGLIARINEDEGLELIASLSGGSFTSIEVVSEGKSVSSEKVDHDQALNFKGSKINTVCFSGVKADSLAQFIANNLENTVTVNFFEGKKTGSLKLDEPTKREISLTWQLYSLKSKAKEFEKNIAYYSRKIDIYRRMLESLEKNDKSKTTTK